MKLPANNMDNISKFILLGEDDIDDQEILEEIFSTVDTSLNLQFFNNGRKVISHFENSNDSLPCLIILDFNMPELNGAEILKILSKNPRLKEIPKIIWSTSDSPVYKSMCLEFGACDYLVKPSKINALEDMVKHMLSYCTIDENK
ncbi:MAG TPA: response regulator [Chitinophagaceae bacterium]|nr:response regulator [Chitinophagaceae bacterium]